MAHHLSRSLLRHLGLVRSPAPRFSCQTVASFTTTTAALCSISSTTPLPQLVDTMTRQLEAAGVAEPQLSAAYLLSSCLSSRDPRVPVLARDWTRVPANTCLSPAQAGTLQTLLQCRLSHVPIQYLVGNWDFRDITVQCRPPVFIPRPETEQLVDLVREQLPGAGCRVLEVGPGTGAVTLALLQESGEAVAGVTCVDRSTAALELTRDNADMLGLGHKVKLVLGRVGGDVELDLEDKYDLIFSNPPYILRKDLPKLSPQISLFEDLRALDGGAEGMDVILPILELAGGKLAPGGQVILEVDPCHPYILPPKLEELPHKFAVDKVVKDFTGQDRFMVLTKC